MISKSQLCSIEQLQSLVRQSSASLRILDGSWYLPSAQRDCRNEFEEQHIAGAQYFDINVICDQNSDLPHMLPSAQQFAEAVGDLGINPDSTVVVYDSAGLFSAARVWWMFKVFSHHDVRVLDGGLPAWQESGLAVTDEVSSCPTGKYTAELNPQLITNKADLITNCDSAEKLVLDARSSERFYGKAPEPRAGLPSGHMPNSVSLPFNQLVKNGRLKAPEQLRKIFSSVGVSEHTQTVTSCGSGVTAAIISLAMVESGLGLPALYDGSWAEWGAAADTVILDKGLV